MHDSACYTDTLNRVAIVGKLKYKNNKMHIIKTHGSELRGQEEAGLRDERVSYLQVAPL